MTAKRDSGSILIHVLITSVLMSVVAAGLISIMLLQYNATQRIESGAKGKKVAEQVVFEMISKWNDPSSGATGGRVCSSNIPNLTCSGVPGTCGCQCPSGGRVVTLPYITAFTVTVNADPTRCKVNVQSPDF